MSALLGYTHDEFVGKELFEIGLLKDAAASQEMVRKLRSGQQVRYEHLPLQGQFGKHQEVEVVANLYDENGHSVIQCNIRDITERKRSEETSARLVAIVDSSTDAIISKDLNGIIQSWNGGAEAIFGYTAAEVLGRSISLLIPTERLPEEQTILAQIARGLSVPHFETVRLRKNGSTVNISVAVSPISDKSGRIIGASKVARDIDQRKRGDEQKALLMAEINHRAKNLLAVVEAVARQSARSGDPGTFVARLAERIRGLAASHDLLVSSQWQGVEVCDLVEAQLAHFKDLIGTRVVIQGARTRITPAAAQGIGMALHELATNAGKYGALSNAEGRVLISWQLTSSTLPTFTMGWLEEGGPMVVAPDTRGLWSKGHRPDGGGSGRRDRRDRLSIPRVLVEIECTVCRHRRGGMGNALCIRCRTMNKHKGRILIVEDEPLVAWTLEEVLVDAGFVVVAIVGRVAKAMAVIKSIACDAAVVDANLAGESASPVAQALAERNLPYLVISGYSREQLPADFPVSHYLQKPCRQTEIIEALTDMVQLLPELPDPKGSKGHVPVRLG